MHTYRFSTTIPIDHRVTAPDEIPPGPAKVTVLVEERDGTMNDDLLAFVDSLAEAPGSTRSKEQIDRELARERDSWE